MGGILGLYAAKAAVRKVVAFKGPAADTLAMANTEVDISGITEGTYSSFSSPNLCNEKFFVGTNFTAVWRGKPVFVRHRSAAEIARESAVNVAELRDPQTDAQRVKNPEWLVCIGVCTHLGCVPIGKLFKFYLFDKCSAALFSWSGRLWGILLSVPRLSLRCVR